MNLASGSSIAQLLKLGDYLRKAVRPALSCSTQDRARGVWTLVGDASVAPGLPEWSQIPPAELRERLLFQGATTYRLQDFLLNIRNQGPAPIQVTALELIVERRREAESSQLFVSPSAGMEVATVLIFRAKERVNQAFSGEMMGGYQQVGVEPHFEKYPRVSLAPGEEVDFRVVVEALRDSLDYSLSVQYRAARRRRTMRITGTRANPFRISGRPDRPFSTSWGTGVLANPHGRAFVEIEDDFRGAPASWIRQRPD